MLIYFENVVIKWSWSTKRTLDTVRNYLFWWIIPFLFIYVHSWASESYVMKNVFLISKSVLRQLALLYSAVLDPGLTRNFLASLVQSAKLYPVPSLMLLHHCARDLPRGLLPSILPSNMFFIIESWRLVWPKNLSLLILIVLRSVFSVSNCFSITFHLLFPTNSSHSSQKPHLTRLYFVTQSFC